MLVRFFLIWVGTFIENISNNKDVDKLIYKKGCIIMHVFNADFWHGGGGAG